MFDVLLSFLSELLIGAFLMLSPARIIRRIVYGIPIKNQPETFWRRILLILSDIGCWLCIAVIAVVLFSGI